MTEIEYVAHMLGDTSKHDALHARFVTRRREKAAWDAEEARDIRRAERLRLWDQYGCITLVQYLELHGGYETRTAIDRLRVAQALEDLPLLEAELENGTFQHSHVRELVRVATPETEEEWIAATRGLSSREVKRMVEGRRKGDRPSDPTRPDDRRYPWVMQMTRATRARLEAAIAKLQAERGDKFVDDEDKAQALCDVLESGGGESEPAQVWITRDGHAFANGVELANAEAETLLCDATLMGDVEDPDAKTTHTISPRKRKRLLARDCGCTVPWCNAKRFLDLHHIEHVEDGGDERDSNLTTLCRGHHRLHHLGLLVIRGSAPDKLVFERRDPEKE